MAYVIMNSHYYSEVHVQYGTVGEDCILQYNITPVRVTQAAHLYRACQVCLSAVLFVKPFQASYRYIHADLCKTALS